LAIFLKSYLVIIWQPCINGRTDIDKKKSMEQKKWFTIKSIWNGIFYMNYTVGWLSSNGNYSSGKPANKLSRFVGALFCRRDYDRLRISKVVVVDVSCTFLCSIKNLNRAYISFMEQKNKNRFPSTRAVPGKCIFVSNFHVCTHTPMKTLLLWG